MGAEEQESIGNEGNLLLQREARDAGKRKCADGAEGQGCRKRLRKKLRQVKKDRKERPKKGRKGRKGQRKAKVERSGKGNGEEKKKGGKRKKVGRRKSFAAKGSERCWKKKMCG